jgi:hypothetical protein
MLKLNRIFNQKNAGNMSLNEGFNCAEYFRKVATTPVLQKAKYGFITDITGLKEMKGH